MPITAKLSRRFYETFGDEIANELVGWFNSVDAQYRTELREMLDTQFRLMRSELEQRIDQRITTVELRLDRRIDGVETRLEKLEARLLGRMEATIGTAVAVSHTKLLHWTIGLWLSTILAVIGSRFL